MREKKVLLTGGAGFIGSHLGDRLLEMGKEVTVYDNLSSGKVENIQHNIGKTGFTFIKADLLDTKALKEAMAGHDLVWHLGANTDIPSGINDTSLDLNNCTIATHNVLETMRHLGIKKLLFTSSSVIYGDIEKMPTAEGDGPILPISLYGAGKLACEAFVSAYCHLFDLQAWMFRFGNVVGFGMGHGVIYDFIHKLRNNPEGMEILGDGTQEKNYFVVEDCIDGMFCAFDNSSKQCDVFNLGSESTVNVTTIARIVVEEMGLKDVRFSYTGGKRGWPGDVPVVKFDLSKIKRLGWKEKHSSADAVRIAARRLLGKEEGKR